MDPSDPSRPQSSPRAQGGFDPLDLRGLIDDCAPALVLYARTWVDLAEAEDLVQESLVRLFASVHGEGGGVPREPRAWLFAAVRNLAITRHRQRKRRRTWSMGERSASNGRAGEHPPLLAAGPRSLVDLELVEWALKSLDPRDREIVVLLVWARLNYRQAAELMQTSAATVLRSYHRSIEQLRSRIETSLAPPRARRSAGSNG